MTSRLDPLLLEAYADNQLTSEEAARVESHLARSPEDRQVVENLREMNARLVSAFEAPMRAPLPTALSNQLRQAGQSPRVRFSWRTAAGPALAASVALVAGYFVGGHLQMAASGLVTGELAETSSLHALLESGRDGSATSLGGGTAALRTTFVDGRGDACREVEWSGGAGKSPGWAVACRRGEDWVVEVAVSRPGAGAPSRDAYVPAAGASEDLVPATLEALDAGPVLGPDEVDLLISSRWSPQQK